MRRLKERTYGFNRLLLRGFIITVIAMLLLGIVGQINTVSAATVKTIPSTDLKVSSSYMLRMGNTNYSAKWTGVSGKVINGKYNYPHLCVPIKSKTSAFTYTNFLDITFTNIGSINGRQLDAKVHFNSMTVAKRGGSATGERSDNYMGVCYLSAYSLWMSTTIDDGSGYRAAKTIDTTTTIYYADTGETVDLPFFQCLQDIDAGASYFKEGWEAKSGFTGTFYKYSPCVLTFSGNKATTPSALNHSGNDSLLKGGFYATTSGGSFRSAFYEGNCASQLNLYTQYSTGNLPKPTLRIDNSKVYEPGEEVIINVKQAIGKLYVNTFTNYTSFEIADDIPQGLTYKKARVLDANGKDVTNKGYINYDEASRTVRFEFNDSVLASDDSYDGSVYTLEITTVADNIDKGMKTIDDTAESSITGITQDTNEQVVRVGIPYNVTYEYESGSNRKLPSWISTTSGDYAISDESKYYTGDVVKRKDTPEDGTKREVYDDKDELVGTWILSWDKETIEIVDENVKFTGIWRYVPAPRLILVKKIENDPELFGQNHGENTFIFKVTGSDSKDSWYKSITFNKDVYDGIANDGYYAGEDGAQFTLVDGYIYGTCSSLYLPEDDYLVEEVKTSRYDETESEANYHGEKKETIGKSTGSIKVPLRLSKYEENEKGYNADYASVVFTNDKVKWNGFSHNDIVINKLK